jgi:mono/diheme cytochrome c family protein
LRHLNKRGQKWAVRMNKDGDKDVKLLGRWMGGPWPYVGLFGFLLFTLGGMLIFRPGAWSERTDLALLADNPRVVALGENIYARACASCHGEDLEGQANWRERLPNGRLPAPPHDETGHTWHHPDEVLFRLTKDGPAALAGGGYESDMPAYADILSDAEIIAVLSYIKSTWPEEIRARHDQMNAARAADE